MSDFSLLNLDSSPKSEQVQMFDIELGIEKFRVGIPVSESASFETKIQANDHLTIDCVKQLAESLNGFVRD